MRITTENKTDSIPVKGLIISTLRYADNTNLLAATIPQIGKNHILDGQSEIGLKITHRMMNVDRIYNNWN